MSGFPSRSAMGARGGKPKIRPPRKPNPENTVKQMWERLAAGIKEIQNHNASSLSYEEHYRYAYNMVLYKNGDQLYSGVKQLITEHLNHLAATLIVPAFPRTDPYLSSAGAGGSSNHAGPSGASGSGSGSGSGSRSVSGGYKTTGKGSAQAVERAIEGDVFLKSVKGVWEDHTASMRKVRDILKYMDTHYTHSAGVPYIIDVGLQLFLQNIVRSPRYPIHTHLMHTILSQIQLERDGETIPRSTVRECIDILLRLSTLPPTAPAAGSGGAFGAASAASANRAAAMTAAAAAAGNAAHTVYATEFEPRFLRKSAEFYEEEAEEGVERGDAAGYLRNEEADRTTHYLSPSTSAQIRGLVIHKLLYPHLHAILAMPNTGLRPMLDDNRMDELGLLYTLYALVPEDEGRQALRQGLKADIEERGKGINAGSTAVASASAGAGAPGAATANGIASGRESPAMNGSQVKQEPTDVDMNIQLDDLPVKEEKGKGKGKAVVGSAASAGAATGASAQAPALAQAVRWVQDVLDLKDKFDRILEQAFQGDKSIQISINEAFQSFINAHQRAPEFLSLYIDEHLKKGSKAKSEDEIEIALEKTITLFRFLTDRDKFEMYYKQHLSKRLLGGRSASDDAEKGMVAKLKIEMGFQFTQKLEGMFTDMRLSAEGANALRNYLTKKGMALPLDMSVSVLTTSHWPVQIVAGSPIALPPILQECTQTFEQYYDSRHSGRRLTWQGNQGTVDLRIRFKARTHEVSCSTQAACVLLCFEELGEGQSLGYYDLKSRTSLNDADLSRTLQSLACGKFRILLKSPKGRDISHTDKFAFNEGFTCPLAKFKIAMVAAKVETAKEKQETEGQVEEERKHQIEACIVRIMKNRKTMSHNDLVSEVAHQLSSRFSPSLGIIKKRIEGLIEREYLERDTEEKGRYKYLA